MDKNTWPPKKVVVHLIKYLPGGPAMPGGPRIPGCPGVPGPLCSTGCGIVIDSPGGPGGPGGPGDPGLPCSPGRPPGPGPPGLPVGPYNQVMCISNCFVQVNVSPLPLVRAFLLFQLVQLLHSGQVLLSHQSGPYKSLKNIQSTSV